MPKTSSTFLGCPFPFTCDIYSGCEHGCKYCYANGRLNSTKRTSFQKIEPKEGVNSVARFIRGERTERDSWCDWNAPIRFGANSDPFQPCERQERRFLSVLKLLAKTGYPFTVTTKGATLAASPEYISVLKDCNCVLQVSMSSPLMDVMEPGAPKYEERLKSVEALSARVQRVMARWQPFFLEHTSTSLKEIPRLADAGVHGLILEPVFGSKFRVSKMQIKSGTRFFYAREDIERHYTTIKAEAHRRGLVFNCVSLRRMSDSICCCGTDGLPGFIPNRCNAMFYYLRPNEFSATCRQRQIGTGDVFNIVSHDRANLYDLKSKSFEDCMKIMIRTELPMDMIVN